MKVGETVQRLRDAKRDALRQLLSQCTEPQQAFFNKLYPGGVDRIAEERLDNAINQCERTIIKNAAKAQGTTP